MVPGASGSAMAAPLACMPCGILFVQEHGHCPACGAASTLTARAWLDRSARSAREPAAQRAWDAQILERASLA